MITWNVNNPFTFKESIKILQSFIDLNTKAGKTLYEFLLSDKYGHGDNQDSNKDIIFDKIMDGKKLVAIYRYIDTGLYTKQTNWGSYISSLPKNSHVVDYMIDSNFSGITNDVTNGIALGYPATEIISFIIKSLMIEHLNKIITNIYVMDAQKSLYTIVLADNDSIQDIKNIINNLEGEIELIKRPSSNGEPLRMIVFLPHEVTNTLYRRAVENLAKRLN